MAKKETKSKAADPVEVTNHKPESEVNVETFLEQTEAQSKENAGGLFIPDALEFEDVKTEVSFHRFTDSKDGLKKGEPELICVYCGEGKAFENKKGQTEKTHLVYDFKNDAFKFINQSKAFERLKQSQNVCGEIFKLKFKHKIVLENGNDFNVFDVSVAKTDYPENLKQHLVQRVEAIRRQWKEVKK